MNPRIFALSALSLLPAVGCMDYGIGAIGQPDVGAGGAVDRPAVWDAGGAVSGGAESPEDTTVPVHRQPDIAVSTEILDFGLSVEEVADVQVFTVTNRGQAPLIIEELAWSVPGTGFTLLTDADSLPALQPGDRVEVEVEFTFGKNAAPSATLVVHSNDPDEPVVPVEALGGTCWDAPAEPFYAIGNATDDLRLVFWDGVDGFSHALTVGEDDGGRYIRPHVGDFDHDGVLEVVAVREDANDLVKVGWGCRRYETRTLASTARFVPHGLGDLNDDGHLDLWGRRGRDNGWVGLGNGDGTFAFSQSFDLSSINSGYAMVLSQKAADVDGDGFVDVVAADYYSQRDTSARISLLRGNGDGSFSDPEPLATFGTATNALDLVDVDGDGQPEVLGGLDDDGDAGQAYVMQVTPDLQTSIVSLFDQNQGAEASSTSNAAGAGRIVAVDWNQDGNLVLMTSKDTDPYAGSSERIEVHMRTLDADGAVQASESALIGDLAGNANIGVPVW